MWKVIKGLILLTGLAECQLQHFLRTPQDTEVTEGDTAVLLCQVGNQIGQVQWTKDGLTLGYDRLLPGFDRYSVLGNDSLGTYNLQVSNASVQDDAKYECQVGPGRGNPPIRANAYLTVNLPPTQIQIMNHLSGSRIDIKENEEVEISCKVSNAKPRAGIIWYRNNVAFNPGTGNIEESSEDGTLPDRKTTFSKIKFRPNSADNQATYACEASHPALRGTAARPANPMRSSVLLSVLYPPEKPEIQGYIEGETIRMGQAVTLVCESYGGNPLAAIVWYKNNQRIDHSYTTSGSKSKNTFMFLAQPDDNNAAYRCEAKNTMITEPLTAQIVMSVQFAPDRVEIRGPDTAKVGQTLNFDCATSNSNPASTLQWVIDGKAQPAIHNRTDTSAEGGWVTSSNVSVMVGHLDKSKTISCYANNFALSETKVETHIVTVLYPPDELSITGYKQGDILQEGSLRRIKCTALSGNPLPELEWFAADKKVEGAKIEKAASGTFVSSEISIKVDRSDNGKTYQCKAKSEATEEPFRKSVALKVSFPPTRVKVEVEPQSPIEGNPAVLKCLTDSSNPDVEILWWHNGELVAGSDYQTQAGKFGGSMTSSLLQIDVTEAHINSVYKCEARHAATSKSVSNTTKIAVQYKPQFIDAPKEIDIEVNSSRIFNINAKGNPEILKYSWIKKGGMEIPSLNNSPLQRGIAASGSSLHLHNIQVEDSGTYIVRVENSIGKSRKSIKVNVEYPPRFVQITRSKLINEGESVKLLCHVDAFPLKTDTIKWERNGYDIASRATVETTTNGSVLSIQNATIKDAGIFICLANNGVPRGKPVEIREKLFLLVNHKPIIDDSPELSKSASDKGGTGKLICQANGAPNVTFKWFREGRAINEEKEIAPRKVKKTSPDGEDEDSDEWMSDTESEESSDEELQTTSVYTRDMFLKKAVDPEKEAKKIEKKEEKSREREMRKKEREQLKAADGDSDDEANDGSWEVVDRTATKVAMFAKDAEITSELVIKKLAEIMAARGKKKTNRKEQIELLNELANIGQEHELGPGIHMKIKFAIIAALFDYNPKLSDAMKPDSWEKCMNGVDELLDLLEEQGDTITSGEHILEDSEQLDVPPFKVRGCFLTSVERLDEEFVKVLKGCDAHSNEYVDRLKDEPKVVEILEKADKLVQKGGSASEICRIYLKRIEHVYFKFDPEVLDQKKGLTEPGKETSHDVMDKFCKYIYSKDSTDRLRTRAILCHIYHHAIHDGWYAARDLMLMSHLQDSVHHSDPETQILYNRTMVQLGLCGFRHAAIKDAHNALLDIQLGGRSKELIAQGLLPQRQHERILRTSEQEKIEKARQMPFHMHINLELLECVYLVSAMLIEIPYLSAHEYDARRRMISKSYYQQLRSSERQALVGPPESMREHVVAASKAMRNGDWRKARDFIINEKMNGKVWDLFYDADSVRAMLSGKIQEESLRTYLFTYSNVYDSISIPVLAELFELEVNNVHALVSKMIINEELMASMDQPTQCIVMHRSEPSRLQSIALQLSDKVSQLVENNERLLEQRGQGGWQNRGWENRGEGGNRGGGGRGGGRGGYQGNRDGDRDESGGGFRGGRGRGGGGGYRGGRDNDGGGRGGRGGFRRDNERAQTYGKAWN